MATVFVWYDKDCANSIERVAWTSFLMHSTRDTTDELNKLREVWIVERLDDRPFQLLHRGHRRFRLRILKLSIIIGESHLKEKRLIIRNKLIIFNFLMRTIVGSDVWNYSCFLITHHRNSSQTDSNSDAFNSTELYHKNHKQYKEYTYRIFLIDSIGLRTAIRIRRIVYDFVVSAEQRIVKVCCSRPERRFFRHRRWGIERTVQLRSFLKKNTVLDGRKWYTHLIV